MASNVPDFALALHEGRCGIGPLTLFDPSKFNTATAAQIRCWQPESVLPPAWRGKRQSRADLLALTAAYEALQDAKLWPLPGELRTVTGVAMGCGAGGMLEAEAVFRQYLDQPTQCHPFAVFSAFSGASSADQLATCLNLNGPKVTLMTACTSGALALVWARNTITAGMANVVIAGGTESLSRMTYGVFNALKAMDPEYCKPFDRYRRGLSLGEGAAILILESKTHAQKRGARIYGALLGCGLSCDAHHITAPQPEGHGAAAAMRAALQDAGLRADQIDTINAHGTATPANDIMETLAIKSVWGSRAPDIPVSAIKSMTGHTLAAAGAIEAVASLLALHQQFVPPTIHCTHPDPICDLDYVREGARARTVRTVLSNSFAFGGNNVCLVFGNGGPNV